jgi:twinkle protein
MDDAATPTPTKAKKVPGLIDHLEFRALPARRITEETCRKFSYGIAEDQGEPIQVAQYWRDGAVVAQKIRRRDKTFVLLGNGKNLPLFGMHLWSGGGKIVVVTEGEIDAMSVSQAQDNKWATVSIPNGASSAAASFRAHLEWLEGYEKVIIMFDQDTPGREAAQAAAEVLSPGKAYIAHLPLKDANECLKADRAADIRHAIWNASPWRPDALLAGSELLERVMAYKAPEGVQSPWKGLEAMVPVLHRPALTVITAGTGVGKSTLTRALEWHLIKAGENIGCLHLEENVLKSALGIVGYELGKRVDLGVEGVKREDLEKAFAATAGRAGVFFYDSFGSTAAENILSRIRYLAKGCGCRYIILDHLSIVVSGLDIVDERKAIDVLMTGLRTLVQETGIHLFVVVHLSRSSTDVEGGGEITLRMLRGSQAIAQLSDNVWALERDQQAEGTARDVSLLRVLKNREWGITGIACGLLFDRRTGRLVEVPPDYGKEAPKDDEFSDTPAPTTPQTEEADF